MKNLFLFVCLFLYSITPLKAQKDSTHFVFTIQTDSIDSIIKDDSSFTITINQNYKYNYDVDWNNDGIFDTSGVTNWITNSYDSSGKYTIRIRGIFPAINFGKSSWERTKLISIDQWGTHIWKNLEKAFFYCNNMTYNAKDTPILDSVFSLAHMFDHAISFDGNISNWDISSVTDIHSMFYFASTFNQDISKWNVSNITDMSNLFAGASSFNQNINNWNVSSLKKMTGMFALTDDFNQDVSLWITNTVDDMRWIFYGAKAFNQNLSNWKIDSAYYMYGIFDSSGMSVTNYDNTLIAWQAKPHKQGVEFGAKGLFYCSSDSARSELIKDGWVFNGDTKDCLTTGIVENTSESAIEIYPNPTSGLLNISLPKNQTLISIYDSNARLIRQLRLNKGDNPIDLSEYPDGLYFIRSGNRSEKIILMH